MRNKIGIKGRYSRPKLGNLTKKNIIDMSNEKFEELAIEFEKCSKHDKLMLEESQEKFKEAFAIILFIWGIDSLEYKYFKRARIPRVSIYYHDIHYYRNLRKEAKEERKKEREMEKTTKMGKEKNERAVIYLIGKGKVLGTDFSLDDAYEVANSLAFDIEIKKQEGSTIPFDECDECNEWTVSDKRCSCGNRRVYWECDGDFEDMNVYPGAY